MTDRYEAQLRALCPALPQSEVTASAQTAQRLDQLVLARRLQEYQTLDAHWSLINLLGAYAQQTTASTP